MSNRFFGRTHESGRAVELTKWCDGAPVAAYEHGQDDDAEIASRKKVNCNLVGLFSVRRPLLEESKQLWCVLTITMPACRVVFECSGYGTGHKYSPDFMRICTTPPGGPFAHGNRQEGEQPRNGRVHKCKLCNATLVGLVLGERPSKSTDVFKFCAQAGDNCDDDIALDSQHQWATQTQKNPPPSSRSAPWSFSGDTANWGPQN
ncbi:hypothetical protein K438DRAFT_274264 [Mycena galopus ATCC 62051]|nr:hypothetical protein K438DRAFT_274264 [Mycena galopus ATCC 62051]